MMDKREQHRRHAAESRKAANDTTFNHIYQPQYGSESDSITREFEKQIQDLHFVKCDICKSVSLYLNIKQQDENGNNICTECFKSKLMTKPESDRGLPVWIDDNQDIHYELPLELTVLTEGEKLLIQQVSAYIPLHHLKFGQIGAKGHSCAFPQYVQDICDILPRLPSDVTLLKVLRNYKNKDQTISTKSFKIRRYVVLAALHWLKNHNREYNNITIKESNLDWMKSDEEELPASTTLYEDCDEEEDMGPSPIQVNTVENDNGVEHAYGFVSQTMNNSPKQKDKDVTNTIHDAIWKSGKEATVQFPYVVPDPIDEYDDSIKIFCKAFPWLFPGGRGDFNEFNDQKITLTNWIKRLLQYQDGRFAKDRMWCFYVYDFMIRHKNMTNGAYFVDGFFENGPETLEDLQREIIKGNTSWVDHITYYSNKIVGSTGYWRSKKAEVFSWINHHVEQKHGPPTLFITLSCAEYFWPDVKRLIKERFAIMKQDLPDLDKNYVQIVNDYTIIIQELFQKRVQIWFDTIGKVIFKILYHWGRFEFSLARGQIHIHFLAICEKLSIFEELYKATKNKYRQADLLQKWVEDTFRMTASLPCNRLNTQGKNWT
jgi:hypothetical protein